MTKSISIGELIQSGKLRVGSFINYEPDRKSFITNPKNTGMAAQDFNNYKKVPWIVAYINNTQNYATIIPFENLVTSFCLIGSVGFVKGCEELNAVSENLGSNSKLGLKAKCPTVEDMCKIFGCDFEKNTKGYAYFPNHIKFGGACKVDGIYYDITSCEEGSKFYESDLGGFTQFDKNGLTYKTPDGNDAVLVSEANYEYLATNCIMEQGCFWLASKYVEPMRYHARYGMHYGDRDGFKGISLFDSIGDGYPRFYGIRPIVNLNSTIQMDISDETFDGTTPEKPFKFVIQNSKDENQYIIVKVKDSNAFNASKMLEEEVNIRIENGYEAVGDFKIVSEEDGVTLLQQMVKK